MATRNVSRRNSRRRCRATRSHGADERSALVAKMIDEGTTHSHVDGRSRVSDSTSSGRVSPGSAGDAPRERLDAAEVSRVRHGPTALEPWNFGVGWTRGPMTLRMLAPQRRELLGVSWAWAPGNERAARWRRGVHGRTHRRRVQSSLSRASSRGKWVMVGAPNPIENPSAPPVTHADSARLDSARRQCAHTTENESFFFTNRTVFIAREKPAVNRLRRGEAVRSLHDERFAARDRVIAVHRRRKRRLLTVRAPCHAWRARSHRSRHQEHIHDETNCNSGIPSRRFAGAKSRTKS